MFLLSSIQALWPGINASYSKCNKFICIIYNYRWGENKLLNCTKTNKCQFIYHLVLVSLLGDLLLYFGTQILNIVYFIMTPEMSNIYT